MNNQDKLYHAYKYNILNEFEIHKLKFAQHLF